MKILFICDNFPPETNAPATRTWEQCKEWAKHGAEVTVITCAPNFPHGKVFDGYENKWRRQEMLDGIRIVRVWSFIARNEGFIKRILDYVSFATTAFLAGLGEKTDIIVATSPQFFVALTGWALSIFKRKPWVFEVRDIWPESIVAVGAMKRNLAIRLLEKLERFFYRRADHIVVVAPAFVDTISAHGIARSKISVVTNGANLTDFTPRPKARALFEQLSLQDKFVVGYIGTHGMAHGLSFVLQAAEKLTDQSIVFLFIGDGAEKQSLVAESEARGLTNVIFHQPISKAEVPEYIALFDCGLVNLRKSDTFKSVIPSKIFELCAMEKPVLLGVDGQARQIIEEFEAGIFYEPENDAALISSLSELQKNYDNYERYKIGARKLAKVYDRKILAAKMLKILKGLGSS